MRAVQGPQRPFPTDRWREVRLKDAAQSGHVHRAVGQRIARARPPSTKGGTETEPNQWTAFAGSQDGIGQLEQTILAVAQAGVPLLAEVTHRRQRLGKQHLPSMTPGFIRA